jgi:hypothetical protein
MNDDRAMTPYDDGDAMITHVEAGAVGAIVKSEVEAQLDAAHRYPRSVTRFRQEAFELATLTQDVAESCLYALPRDGKMIIGPSVRFAEICASAFGNLHAAARVLETDDSVVTAQGVAWDLQKNWRVSIEAKRRITGKGGRRYSDDMVVVTGNAAASIALRNAIFRVIPRSYVNEIFERVKRVAVGDAKTLTARRAEVIGGLTKMGATLDRILARVGKAGAPDVGLEELEILIGLGTAIKNGESTVDEAFPAPLAAPAAPADDGKRLSVKKPEAPPPREPGAEG